MDFNQTLTGQEPIFGEPEPPYVERLDDGIHAERADHKTRFQPGNTAAWKDGSRSKRALSLELPEQAEAKAALGDRVETIARDLGGRESLSQVAVGMVERHAKLELVADYLFSNIQRLGPLTGKGHTRAALTNWLAVVDRLQRSAVTLGLERRSKPVVPLAEVLRGE
jgi:hypothetical protein